MKTKDRKRQIKQYQKKLKIVNSYYKARERNYLNTIKGLEEQLKHTENHKNEIFHNLYRCENAVLAFAKYLERTGNEKALKELDSMFNLHDTKCPTKKERERRRRKGGKK